MCTAYRRAWPRTKSVYPNNEINMHNHLVLLLLRRRLLLQSKVLHAPLLAPTLLFIRAQIQRHTAPPPSAIALRAPYERSRRRERVLRLEPPAQVVYGYDFPLLSR